MRSSLLQAAISPSRRPFWVLAALLFLAGFGLRLATLHGAFHPDDSPETILAGATLGIQHPPSYPLDSLLSRLAVLGLPGSPSFQANVLAAGLSALAATLLVALALAVVGSLPADPEVGAAPQILLTLAFAWGALTQPQLWFQGLSAKGGIYGLNLCLTLACLGLFWAGRDGKSTKLPLLGTLLAGLGLADHYMSFVLFGPALLYWSWRSRPDLKYHAKLALWLLPGLSLYLYLPLRAAQQPFLNWGDPHNWASFWDAILRSQYSAAETTRSLGKTGILTKHFFTLLPGEIPWVAAALALVGIDKLWRQAQLAWRPLLLCLGLHLFMVLYYNNPPLPWVINAFFVPDFALLWLLAFVGAVACLPSIKAWHPQAALGLSLLSLAAVLALAPQRYRQNDYSQDFALYDYSRDLQTNLAPNSALLAAGGNDAFGLWYLQGVEKRRADVTVVDVPLLSPWYLSQLRSRLPELDPGWTLPTQVVEGLLSAPKRPLYYSSHNPGDRGIPLGLVTLVPPPGMALPLTVDGLLGRFKALRLRWVADTRTPWDGNRGELLEYYELSAKALEGFGQRQGVGPLVTGTHEWAVAFAGSSSHD